MTSTRACHRCGTPFAPEASPQGLCPRCLLELGMRDPDEIVVTGGIARAATAPSVAELAPLFPDLAIGELIGQGGMGWIYRARQLELDRHVALKLLARERFEHDPSFAERFRREARTLAKLSHPGVVGVYATGEVGGWCYLVLELVDGVDLRRLMRERAIEPKQALSIVAQICDALQYSHEQGVVHRDIKPENVLIDRSGRVKIADFGLARLLAGDRLDPRLTGSHQVMGTPHYMAPEQWEKPHSVDHRADIYALGVVFYELLTGEMPLGRFAAPSKRIQIDVRLDEVVFKALEKEPDRRYQHASEVKDDVERIEREPAIASRPTASRASRDTEGARVDVKASIPRTSSKELALGAVHLLGWFLLLAGFAVQLQAHTYFQAGAPELGGWIAVAVVAAAVGLVTVVVSYRVLAKSGSVPSRERRRHWHAHDALVGLSVIASALALLGANFSAQDTRPTEFAWIVGATWTAVGGIYLIGRAIDVSRRRDSEPRARAAAPIAPSLLHILLASLCVFTGSGGTVAMIIGLLRPEMAESRWSWLGGGLLAVFAGAVGLDWLSRNVRDSGDRTLLAARGRTWLDHAMMVTAVLGLALALGAWMAKLTPSARLARGMSGFAVGAAGYYSMMRMHRRQKADAAEASAGSRSNADGS